MIDKKEWESFGAYTFRVDKDENNSSDCPSLLTKLHNNNIILILLCLILLLNVQTRLWYTTVDEACSGLVGSVGKFSAKLIVHWC